MIPVNRDWGGKSIEYIIEVASSGIKLLKSIQSAPQDDSSERQVAGEFISWLPYTLS